MQIVIDVTEEYYNVIKAIPDRQCTADMLIIKRGTPLPKGHGRLIDADVVTDGFEDNYELCIAVNATQTIIKADKG